MSAMHSILFVYLILLMQIPLRVRLFIPVGDIDGEIELRTLYLPRWFRLGTQLSDILIMRGMTILGSQYKPTRIDFLVISSQ